ncbi:MAG TPA: carbon storage regulator, partial [Candidatus Tectomicrobia bacterium]|nr:carbon storage regulator [Candidatus Tectomicrobia bacterium]
MLVITRKKNEKLLIGDNIEITVLEVGHNRVRLGMKAPQDVAIHTRIKS